MDTKQQSIELDHYGWIDDEIDWIIGFFSSIGIKLRVKRVGETNIKYLAIIEGKKYQYKFCKFSTAFDLMDRIVDNFKVQSDIPVNDEVIYKRTIKRLEEAVEAMKKNSSSNINAMDWYKVKIGVLQKQVFELETEKIKLSHSRAYYKRKSKDQAKELKSLHKENWELVKKKNELSRKYEGTLRYYFDVLITKIKKWFSKWIQNSPPSR